MFRLIDNRFLNDGICRYKDEYGNILFLKRGEEHNFVASIRFANKNVTASPVYIEVPIVNPEGTMLHLEYKDGIDHQEDEDVKCAISGCSDIITKWINMMYDLIFSVADAGFITKANDGRVSTEDIAKEKFARLSQYEELSQAINQVMAHM